MLVRTCAIDASSPVHYPISAGGHTALPATRGVSAGHFHFQWGKGRHFLSGPSARRDDPRPASPGVPWTLGAAIRGDRRHLGKLGKHGISRKWGKVVNRVAAECECIYMLMWTRPTRSRSDRDGWEWWWPRCELDADDATYTAPPAATLRYAT